MRIAVLGGEVRRRSFLGSLSKPAYVALGVAAAGAFVFWIGVRGVGGGVAGVLLFGGTWALVHPWSGRRSLVENWLWTLRWTLRLRAGHTTYIATGARAMPDEDATGPLWELPVPLGRVEPLPLKDTGYDDMFVLHHHNPGERPYLSVVLEVQGQAAGLRSEHSYDTTSIRYGVLLAQLGKHGSFIRGLQQINRILPHDPALHRAFVASRVSTRPGLSALVESYEDLVEGTALVAEQHRNYLVARFPLTLEFFEEARPFGAGVVGWAGLVREELARLADLASRGELSRPLVLGEQRTCAVLRSLQDPSWPIDRHEGARWDNCWQSYVTEAEQLVVNDRWYTRTAVLPRDGIAPAPLGPRWLAPLLTSVSPSVIRTLSVRMEFVPDKTARARAVKDVTQDSASMLGDAKSGSIDDGTDSVLLSASQRRLRDLAPGSGHQGVDWSMAISVTAADPAELRRACMRVANEAAGSAITDLVWQDEAHDLAVLATYPLARGMAVA